MSDIDTAAVDSLKRLTPTGQLVKQTLISGSARRRCGHFPPKYTAKWCILI